MATRASKLSSFTHRPQTGNWRRKLTASSGASGFATFVREIGELAEAEGHHPNISFGWGNATVSLQTKKIKGLHENDFIMATKIDRIFARTAAA
jgi:pterin-4a-carbinolamine dehydratase